MSEKTTTMKTKRAANGATAPLPIDSDEIVLRPASVNHARKYHRAIETDDGELEAACHNRSKRGWKEQPRRLLGEFYDPCSYCYNVGSRR